MPLYRWCQKHTQAKNQNNADIINKLSEGLSLTEIMHQWHYSVLRMGQYAIKIQWELTDHTPMSMQYNDEVTGGTRGLVFWTSVQSWTELLFIFPLALLSCTWPLFCPGAKFYLSNSNKLFRPRHIQDGLNLCAPHIALSSGSRVMNANRFHLKMTHCTSHLSSHALITAGLTSTQLA